MWLAAGYLSISIPPARFLVDLLFAGMARVGRGTSGTATLFSPHWPIRAARPLFIWGAYSPLSKSRRWGVGFVPDDVAYIKSVRRGGPPELVCGD